MARKRPLKRSFGNIRPLDSGRQQARWTVNGVDSTRTFDTEREAKDFLVLTEATLIRDGWSNPLLSEITLATYVGFWLLSRADIRDSTRNLYESLATRFILGPFDEEPVAIANPRLGDLRLREVAPHHVAAWHQWVREVSARGMMRKQEITLGSPRENIFIRTWARETEREVKETGRLPQGLREAWHKAGRPGLPSPKANPGATQASQAYRLLTSIFATALREERVTKNPCDLQGAGHTKAPRRGVLTDKEVKALAQGMPERYSLAIHFAVDSGLRAGEVFALQRKHVDLEKGAVTVAQTQVRRTDGKLVTGPPKSEAGYRTVFLPPRLTALLSAHMDAFTAEGADAWVFGTCNNTLLTGSNRTAMFRRAADRMGLTDSVFHQLRHTGATLAAEAGASTAHLMRRMGHSTPRAALHYQYVRDETDRLLAARMDAIRAT